MRSRIFDVAGPMSDQATLSSVRAADQTAFVQLCESWEPVLDAFATGFAKGEFDRDDYVQRGRKALHEACLTWPDDGVSFEGYARRAARFAMIDLLRENRSRGAGVVQFMDGRQIREVPVLPPDHLTDAEDALAIHIWLTSLSSQDRDVITLVIWADLKQAEVGRRLNLTRARINQIYQAVLRDGREKFKTLLN